MPALSLRSISRRFGPVAALREVDFDLEWGEVHVLLGENGAGKSSLMNIAYGLLRPDTGTIQVDGRPVQITSPVTARRLGIGMVHQHFTSIPALSVGENIALAADWRLRRGPAQVRTLELCSRFGVSLDPDRPAGDLPVSALQRLEIIKAMAGGASILLLDEPTAVLSPREKSELLDRIRGFSRDGGGVVLITHKLEEALTCADRITVLRHGVVTFHGPNDGLTGDDLAALMVGQHIAPVPPAPVRTAGELLVHVQGLSVPDPLGRRPGLVDATFGIRSGEVVGIVAVEGNGQRELLRCVAGLLPPGGGTLRVAGPGAFIPEDRVLEGLIGEFSLAENVTLGLSAGAPWIRRGWIDWREAARRTADLLLEFDVRTSGPWSLASTLSGGNQQKLILARALAGEPRVIVAEDPARGLDFRAARSVLSRLREAARAGAAVLLYASDLDEVLEWADRVIVVVDGRTTELDPGHPAGPGGRTDAGSGGRKRVSAA